MTRILNKEPKPFVLEFWRTSDPDAEPIRVDEREFDTLDLAIAAGTAAAPDYPDHIQISEYGDISLDELEPGIAEWSRNDPTNHHDL